ncbi:MAG: sigma-70 family RNA polymerase sigma factor [Cyclobacteriaceae bacterium]|jgi:RNA polymerase sigma factor (sigma-70 family)|nr:sigma-70 family RNA polymerase sigma factor [Cyclobacteriaceae bacterium]
MNQAQAIALYHPLLHSVAYNILRCKHDAEDIVQDTFVKWLSIDQTKIQNTQAYLITSVINNCKNHLNTLRKKKEEYWESSKLSQLIVRFKETDFKHMDMEAELSAAFKVLQSKLEPLERAAYLLREVFDFDYESIQKVLDKKADHCRQLLSRAKKKMSDSTAKIHFEMPDSHLLEAFKKACSASPSIFIQHLKNDISSVQEKKS